MQLTLLQLVQDMLVAIDAENVASTSDTTESAMCVAIANRKYEELMSMFRWRHLRQYSTFSTNANKNQLVVPVGTVAIDPNSLWYGVSDEEQPIFWLTPNDFLSVTIRRTVADSDVEKIANIKSYNDRNPQYFTSDDDEILTLDAFPDSSGLVGTDCTGILYIISTSRLSSNSSIFDLPAVAFPALSSLCIAAAIGELKGDTQGAQLEKRNFTRIMSSVMRNTRLVDVLDDRRSHIVPRHPLSTNRRITI